MRNNVSLASGCLALVFVFVPPTLFIVTGHPKLAILAFALIGPIIWLVDWVPHVWYGGTPLQHGFKTRCHGFPNYLNPFKQAYAPRPTSGRIWNVGWKVADYLARYKFGRLMVNFRVPEAYNVGRVARSEGITFDKNPYASREELRSWNFGWLDEEERLKGALSPLPLR